MLICKNCGYTFEKPRKIYETHGLLNPPYESLSVCPNCNSQEFAEKIFTHCRCCGAKLKGGEEGYCSKACEEKGERLRSIEKRKRKILEESPLSEIVRRVKYYNMEHGTNYSYGQYVAIIMPKEKAAKKCKKKRKIT